MPILRLLILIVTQALVTSAQAEVPPADANPWEVAIAVGYGERGNPLNNSDDIPIILEFDIGWYGERFFFDNGDLGYTFFDGNTVTLSTVIRINSDRLFFTRADLDFVVVGIAQVPIEPPGRDYAIEAGVELLSSGAWGRAQFTAFHDASSTHNGFELSGHFARGFRKQRWYFEPSLSLSYKNSQLNDYYWGVTPTEGNLLLPAYRANAGLNTTLHFTLSYQITRHWAAVSSWRTEWLSDEITNSPIVDSNTVSSQYAGFRYTF